MAGLSGNAGASPPSAQDCAPCPRAARVQPRGGKGRSPLHKKTPNLPLPHGGRALCERGSGGWGKNLVIWLVNPATKTAVPPVGDSDGRVIRQRRGKPPARRRIAPSAPAPPGFSPGDARGEAPCIRKPKNSPFPMGEERSASAGREDRGKKFMMRQAQPATEKSSHPSKPTAAKKTVSRRRRTPLPPCSQSTSSTRQSGRTVRSDGCSTYRRISLKAEA